MLKARPTVKNLKGGSQEMAVMVSVNSNNKKLITIQVNFVWIPSEAG